MDKVILNGHGYDLPKKTLAVAEKIDRLSEAESQYTKGTINSRECVTAEYEFLREILGDETTANILGTDDLTEADLSDISIAVMNILRAYRKRVEQESLRNVSSTLNTPEVKKVLEVAEKANNLNK